MKQLVSVISHITCNKVVPCKSAFILLVDQQSKKKEEVHFWYQSNCSNETSTTVQSHLLHPAALLLLLLRRVEGASRETSHCTLCPSHMVVAVYQMICQRISLHSSVVLAGHPKENNTTALIKLIIINSIAPFQQQPGI